VALGDPVKGLYLTGAAVPPGAGVHGACGDLAARQVLADQRRAGRLAAAAAMGTAMAALQATRRSR
jgi:hypothetical protein